MKGIVSIQTLLFTVLGTLIASGVVSFAAATTKVSVVDQRETDHYSQIQQQLTQVIASQEKTNTKLDTLIGKMTKNI